MEQRETDGRTSTSLNASRVGGGGIIPATSALHGTVLFISQLIYVPLPGNMFVVPPGHQTSGRVYG